MDWLQLYVQCQNNLKNNPFYYTTIDWSDVEDLFWLHGFSACEY